MFSIVRLSSPLCEIEVGRGREGGKNEESKGEKASGEDHRGFGDWGY